MSTELETFAVPDWMVPDPITGEALTNTSPTEDLARFLTSVREQKSMMNEAQNLVQREIVRRMDFHRKWTLHTSAGKLTAPSPKPSEEWDAAELRERLLEFVDRGDISIEALDAAVETVVDYKIHKAGIEALRKGGGDVADAINALARAVEKDRRVSVGRAA